MPDSGGSTREGGTAMDYRAVVAKRASVRKFTDESVPEADLQEIARLAGMAPSVNNSQPWKMIAVTNKDLLNRMASAVKKKIAQLLPETTEDILEARRKVEWFSTFFADAPAVFVIISLPYEAVVDSALSKVNLTHEQINAMRGHPDVQSIGALVQTLLLAATDMGYGACWLSGPVVAREDLEKILGVPESGKVAAMVAVGKAAADVKQKEKKPLSDVFEIRS